MRARRRRPRRRAAHWLVRLVSAILLSLFFGTTALAFAAPLLRDDCCEHEEKDAHGCPKDNCACASDCPACGTMSSARVIPTEPWSDLLPGTLGEILAIPAPVQSPSSAEPAEILHVPKG